MTTIIEVGSEVNIRLFTYKSRRHYGGRDITTTAHIVKAKLYATQGGHQKYIVDLLEAGAGYPKSHRIAVCENDFNL
jgi:hypothetical protein